MSNATFNGKKAYNNMDAVFYPNSVAIIGARTDSERELKTGWVGKLTRFDYKGKIYPINPKAKEILGHRAYPTIGDVPDPVEYAIITVNRNLVANAVKECISKRVKTIHIYTGGFSEVGTEEGIALEKELKEIIENCDCRVIGPNCLGVYSPSGGPSFDPGLPKEPGSIYSISQTGVGSRRLIRLAMGKGLLFKKAVSFGNSIDLGANDFLEDALQDSDVNLVFLYLEGISEGQRFFNILRKCAEQKPVVLLKAGMSEAGKNAVASHTASIAGDKQVWEALFKQTGAIKVQTLEEAVEQMIALQTIRPLKGRGVGLIGRGGGLGVIATDMCESVGLKVPQLGKKTRKSLEKIIPASFGSTVGNPVEIGLGHTGISEQYVDGLEIVASDPQIDCLISFLNPADYIHFGFEGWAEDTINAMKKAKGIINKPIALVFLPGLNSEVFATVVEIQRKLFEHGIGCFSSMDTAIKAIGKMADYYEIIAD
ncbi:MAG: CoA-binding protein [SAR324 cluster bacterium]|nr:CoA-binding protein [SAR324 cluster bacterium]